MNINILPETKMHEGVVDLAKRNADVRQYHSRRLARQDENWYFYWGLDAELGRGQYPADVVSYMIEQKRQLLTYNFAKTIVDTMAGGILQNLYHPKFIGPAKYSGELKAIENASYADKEIMNWEAAWFEYIIQGCVGEGCMKIVISREFNDLGNIGYKPMIPGSFATDPGWHSRTVKDLNYGYQEGLWLPEELLKFFPEKHDVIMGSMQISKDSTRRQPTYGPNTGITPYKTTDLEWGDRKKCISEYRMVEKKVEAECVWVDGDEVEIPDNIPEDMRPKWLNENYPNWQPDMVYSKPKIKRECMVRVAAPGFLREGFLYDGPAQVQCGHPPFHIWSCSMHNGERHTVIDAIKDACRNINYWEAMATHKLQVTGGGGSKIGDPKGFKNREEFENAARTYGDPTKVYESAPGQLVDGKGSPFQPLIKYEAQDGIFNHINHIIQILPYISKINPATLGRVEEENQTSGRLFRLLKIQGDQQVFTDNFGLKLNFQDIFDSYFPVAVDLLGSEDVYRMLRWNEGRESMEINGRVYDEYGNERVLNQVSKLKNIRHQTIITETSSSPTKQANNVELMRGFLESLGPLAQVKPLTVSIITKKMADNMTQFDEEDKQALAAAGEKEAELQLAKIDLEIASAKMQTAQIQAQMGGVGQVPGAHTPGAPPGGMLGNAPSIQPPAKRLELAAPQGPNINQNPPPQGEEAL